jgi:presenilin-like A22 family membrane protease
MAEKLQWDSEKIQSMITLELLCVAVWLLGILFYHLPLPLSTAAIERSQAEFSLLTDASSTFAAVLLALLLLYLLRKVKAVGLAVAILLGVLIYSALSTFVEPLVAFLVCVMLVYINRAYRSFLANNMLVVLGVFGGAIPFAIFYKVDFILLLLGLFAVYDVFGVLFTKAIPKVAMGAIVQGAPLILLAPKRVARWRDVPSHENAAAVMGAGDLFLPLLFLMAVSVQLGMLRAFVCLLGAAIGSAANLFLLRQSQRGIPAMPFLAAGMAAAYFFLKL